MLSDAVSLWFSHLLLEFGEVNPGGPTMDNQPLLSILPVRAAQPSVVSGQHEAGGYSQAPSCRTASASQCFVWPGLGKGGWNWNGLLLAYTDVLKKTKKKKKPALAREKLFLNNCLFTVSCGTGIHHYSSFPEYSNSLRMLCARKSHFQMISSHSIRLSFPLLCFSPS